MSVDGLQEYIEQSLECLDENILTIHTLTHPNRLVDDKYYENIYEEAKAYCKQWEKLKDLL